MFPDLILDYLAEKLIHIEGVEVIVKRSLNELDENGTLGIQASMWQPVDYEMGGITDEPSFVEYEFILGHMVKDAEQEVGQQVHRQVAKSLLDMLYRDQDFAVGFHTLMAYDDVTMRTERVLTYKVTAQRYASNEIAGNFVSMSATELNVQVQTV